MVNHIRNNIAEATNVFTTPIVKGVAGNIISEVKGEGTGYNTRIRQQEKAAALLLSDQTTSVDTSEMNNDN